MSSHKHKCDTLCKAVKVKIIDSQLAFKHIQYSLTSMGEFSLERVFCISFSRFQLSFLFILNITSELLIVALSSAVKSVLCVGHSLADTFQSTAMASQSSNPRRNLLLQVHSILSVCLSLRPSICVSVYLERIVFQGWASLHVCLAATRRIISSNNSNSNNGNKISKQKQQQQ